MRAHQSLQSSHITDNRRLITALADHLQLCSKSTKLQGQLSDMLHLNDVSPLESLTKIFGSSSVERWIEIGLDSLLLKGLQEGCSCLGLHSNCPDHKYLVILNEIIPPLPRMMEDALDLEKECRQRSMRRTPGNSRESIEKLISKLIGTVTELFVRSWSCVDKSSLLVDLVFLKLIYHANERTIADNELILKDFMNRSRKYLRNFCSKTSHSFMTAVLILSKKLPADLFERLFDRDHILELVHCLKTSHERTCFVVHELNHLLSEGLFEDVLSARKSQVAPLLGTLDSFEDSVSFYTALAEFTYDGLLLPMEILHLDILSQLEDALLFPPQPSCTKAFLSIFLKLKIDRDGQSSWSRKSFKNLVDIFSMLFERLIEQRVTMTSSEDVLKHFTSDACERTRKELEVDIRRTLALIQFLYALNSSWHHWFDLVDVPPILDNEFFVSRTFVKMVDSDLESEGNNLSWITHMTMYSPSVLPFETRRLLLRHLLLGIMGSCPTREFKVSRKQVLKDVKQLFNCYDPALYWNFSFIGELGLGAGPTREVYTVLSQVLQEHHLDLWQGEPARRSNSEEMLYTLSSSGLLPKFSAESGSSSLETFEFIGKLLAKALLDEHLLDIPLSDEFLRRLSPKSLDYLRKGHHELSQTFPVAGDVIEKLIESKRKIENIQADPDLEPDEKDDLIRNLKFADDASFDDLFLNFTVPGTDLELIEGGHDVALTSLNVVEYLKALCVKREQFLGSEPFRLVREGFQKVLPLWVLLLFQGDELKTLFCGVQMKQWTVEYLNSSCDVANGYTKDSEAVKFLFQVLASFGADEQKMFLRFVTSRASLDHEGLDGLVPRLTVFKAKFVQESVAAPLPTASTCANAIFLPEYDSLDVTRERLLFAISEGGDSFQFV